MSARDRAYRDHGQRTQWRTASAVMDDYLIQTKRRRLIVMPKAHPFLSGVGAAVAPVKVYAPNGTLKEVVSAEEWRRRHGDPFREHKPEEDM